MSMWQSVQGASKSAGKYTSWPNPFKNAVKKIDVLACEKVWQARVEMWGIASANWAWSSFIPSPVEISRKFIAGSYKCGFYFTRGTGSPLDLIWKDGRASAVLLEMASPLTKALFYWWAAETAWSALDTWQSIIHKGELCDTLGHETMLMNGVGTFPGGSGDRLGSAGLYEVLYDPMHRYGALGGGVNIAPAQAVTASACGYMVAQGSTLTNVEVWVQMGNLVTAHALIGSVPPFTATPFSVSWETGSFAGNVSVSFSCHVEGLTILPNHIDVTRFTVTADAPDDRPPGEIFKHNPEQMLCLKLYEQVYATGVG